jgi:two-component system, NarL family, sensor histidine kinase BarA
MAYNPLKRIFGETKLELKLLFLFGAGLLVIITTAFWLYGARTARLVYEQNQNRGRLLVDRYMLTLHWGKIDADSLRSNHPVMLEMTPEEKKADQEKTDQWINMISDLMGYEKSTTELIWSKKKDGLEQPGDDFERGVCDKFQNSPPPPENEANSDTPGQFAERSTSLRKDDERYEYFRPIRAKHNCLTCHGVEAALGGAGIDAHGTGVPMAGAAGTRIKEGDVMAIAKVSFSVGKTHEKLNKNSAILWTFAVVTVFVGMLTLYFIARYVIVKPVRHLRDVSDAVTRGNIALRANIHTGDEFEELATAFNRMLRTLITIQDELRQANVNLDGKVDEMAQMNMRLYEMNLLKSDFLATMSHELRTPLNSILGFSEVLAGIQSLDDKQKRYVQNIQKSGRTLLEMINDILDLAKMESGKMETRLTEFRVQQIVSAQADMARPLAEKKNIDLDTEIEPDLPPMRQDQARVQQILNNLLSNAIKFTPEGGRVTITAVRDADDFLVLRVIDTGVGMAEEDQQVIFEKFRQGRVGVPSGDAMTREYSGSGLGLSIVKELCKLLGGEVAVASELGKGSTFTVRVPWAIDEPARNDAPISEEAGQFAQARFE